MLQLVDEPQAQECCDAGRIHQRKRTKRKECPYSKSQFQRCLALLVFVLLSDGQLIKPDIRLVEGWVRPLLGNKPTKSQRCITSETATQNRGLLTTFDFYPRQQGCHRLHLQSLLDNRGSTATIVDSNNVLDSMSTRKIPYIIEPIRISQHPWLYQEIADMCIEAFFNDDDSSDKDDQGLEKITAWPLSRKMERKYTPIWKQWQLLYLRQLQQNDLRRRRKNQVDTNFMLVAREVISASTTNSNNPTSSLTRQGVAPSSLPTSSVAAHNRDSNVADASRNMSRRNTRMEPLILDLTRHVYNLTPVDIAAAGGDFIRGDVLGFVEVTLRPYGLGDEKIGFDEDSKIQCRNAKFYRPRPVLTNLSVRRDVRAFGIGSKLVEICEQMVMRKWNQYEIILEVEGDNPQAQRFYEKRGYKVLFVDPASRRYDTTGFILRQVRCQRTIMRKSFFFSLGGLLGGSGGANRSLTSSTASTSTTEVGSTVRMGLQALQRLRDNVFSSSSS